MASEFETLTAIGSSRNPVQETRFKELSAGRTSGGGSSFGDFSNTIQKAIELNRKAAQPAISSLQASIPEVQQKFATQKTQLEGQKTPLKERYANLLADIKGQGKISEEAQTRITSGELGKRGIVGSSTLAGQEIQRAVEPIRAGLRTATKEIGLGQEEGLRGIENAITNLTGLEVDQVRAVTNAIAQLQSGAGQAGVTQGLATESFNQAQQQAQAQAVKDKAERDRLFSQVTLPQSQAAVAASRRAGAVPDPSKYLNFNNLGNQFNPFQGLSIGSNVINLLKGGDLEGALNLAMNP